jgi:hypothetical protein
VIDKELAPNYGDMRRAQVFVAAWRDEDPYTLRAIVDEANEAGRSIHLLGALAERLVHGFDLRDNEAAMASWRADIAQYAQEEENERNQN